MRPSLSLVALGLLCGLSYGFSCTSTAFGLPSTNYASRTTFPLSSEKKTRTLRLASLTTDPISSLRGGGVTKATSGVDGEDLPSLATGPVSSLQGGAVVKTTPGVDGEKLTLPTILASLWGTGGVAYILVKAIKRVLPIALEPFINNIGLTQLQLGAYISMCVWFAYVEGYKGFQTKFSPLVVSRSLTLGNSGTPIHHLLLAPFFSMGLFHATKKRMIISWSVSLGVAGIVAAVKKLPYPWRNIVDAGVVAGLTWGTISMLLGYGKAVFNNGSHTDPCLPEKK